MWESDGLGLAKVMAVRIQVTRPYQKGLATSLLSKDFAPAFDRADITPTRSCHPSVL